MTEEFVHDLSDLTGVSPSDINQLFRMLGMLILSKVVTSDSDVVTFSVIPFWDITFDKQTKMSTVSCRGAESYNSLVQATKGTNSILNEFLLSFDKQLNIDNLYSINKR